MIDELNWNAAIDSSKVDVAVNDGLVTLGGQVSNFSEKWQAEQTVQRVAGVKALVVKIVVAPTGTRTDADIARAVESALEWVCFVPNDSIKIQVERGWITLSGTVEWDYQRQAVAGAARYLLGVKGVIDKSSIMSKVPPNENKAGIEAALGRRFDADEQDIMVSVTGKTVTLSGTVTSWWQRDLARESAWNAPGVQNVTDQMTIRD